jgi:DNA-directed RNA polymerase specialized sigma24 family protein
MTEGPEPPSRKGPGVALWVNPVDDENQPVDPVFINAATARGESFIAYRARELQDESLAKELLEKAVHSASRARRGKPVRDPLAYVFRIFKRLVDDEIAKSRRFIPLNEEVLYRRADGEQPVELEEALRWRETFESLDDTTRGLLRKLFWGFRVGEISERLGIKRNTLSKRISRVRKELKNRLDGNSAKAPISEPDDKGNAGQIHPGRNLPTDGSKRAA